MSTIIEKPRLSTSACDFIDEGQLHGLLRRKPAAGELAEVIAKSMAKEALSLAETAVLLAADDEESCQRIFEAARQLKRDVYGNRIVLFAPLYVGSSCRNDCLYCAFRRSNADVVRRTLSPDDLQAQVAAMERKGHKRTILVFGEHPKYNAEFIADCVRTVYSVKVDHGEIRRVNVNAAPMDHEGFCTIRAAGIGTYQIFQETYHHETYAHVHPESTRKGDYLWRLDALSRAMESGCDDVGIGVLFGLYDWKFEVLGLVAHALHLQKHYNVGPHTVSFPRLRPAHGVTIDERHLVNDHEFKRLVAILRLAVPYTGLILTAREPAALRREVLGLRRLADRRRQPHRTGRLHRGRRRPGNGTRAVRAGRYPLAGRSDEGTDGRWLRAQLLHGLLPSGPHGRTFHGVRHSGLHSEPLHAQRPDDAHGIPDRLRRRRDPRRGDAADRAGTCPAARRQAEGRSDGAVAEDSRDGAEGFILLVGLPSSCRGKKHVDR